MNRHNSIMAAPPKTKSKGETQHLTTDNHDYKHPTLVYHVRGVKGPIKMSEFLPPKKGGSDTGTDKVNLAPNVKFHIDRLKFQILKVLGDGSYSFVYKIKKENGSIRALKVIQPPNQSQRYQTRFLPRELDLLKRIKHENIIETEKIFYDKNMTVVLIVMRFASGGTLYDLIKRWKKIPEPKAKVFYIGMVKGLGFMHSVGACHRDLKTENILIDGNGIPKLTDFSYGLFLQSQKHLSATYCGTHEYLAPEVLDNIPYEPKPADVWSMGILLFEMLNGDVPFADRSTDVSDMKKRRYKFSVNLSQDVKQLIQKILDPNAKSRITIEGVLGHPWLKEVSLQWEGQRPTPSLIASKE